MIVVRLRGGIGNQMFQYAFGKSVALARGERLLLDASWYRNANRALMIDQFNIHPSGIIRQKAIVSLLRFLLGNRTQTDAGGSRGLVAPVFLGKNFFNGFWENYRYVETLAPLLLKEFTLKDPSAGFVARAGEIGEMEAISLHVRRGDFKTFAGRRLLDKEYYEKAVTEMLKRTRITNPQFLIFSDDTAWCKENLASIGGYATTVIEDPLMNESEELVLMSLCKHNIIANSTFSWWAAFLNQNPDRVVVAPYDWGRDPETNVQARDNLLPPAWVTV